MRRLPDDPDIRELLPGFCGDWRAILEVRGWPPVLAARDVRGLGQLGHTVKGSFAQFGLPDGSALGEELLASARAEDWEGAARHVEALLLLVVTLGDELAAARPG